MVRGSLYLKHSVQRAEPISLSFSALAVSDMEKKPIYYWVDSVLQSPASWPRSQTCNLLHHNRAFSMQAHNVEMMSHWRRCDVMTSHRRQCDVISMWWRRTDVSVTSVACWVKPLNNGTSVHTYYKTEVTTWNSRVQVNLLHTWAQLFKALLA